MSASQRRAFPGGFGALRGAAAALVFAMSVPCLAWQGGVQPARPDAPEIATGLAPRPAAQAGRTMAVTAHPSASEAALAVLERGGSVADAALAAQLVLNVVEPQSSGIGGGAFLLLYDAASGRVRAFDGRETAPAAASGDYLRRVHAQGEEPVRPNARHSGRSVGVPGTLRVLELAHGEYGRLPWASLFEPAIALAREGYEVGPRLSASLADAADALRRDPTATEALLPGGAVPAPGTRLRNPALADTLAQVAREGAGAFYAGPLAEALVARVAAPPAGATPGAMTRDDLAGYRALEREPVCAPYRRWDVCGFPPPSSGGLAVAQMLGILAHFDLAALAPVAAAQDGSASDAQPALDARAVHLIAEAGRLAFADRDHYVADPDFADPPPGGWQAMLDADYLAGRAARIDPARSMGRAQPGLAAAFGADTGAGQPETSHLTLVDAQGNVLAMTSTIEGGFGSFMMVNGFLLNNELTDFSTRARDDDGRPIANRVEGGKRPRSSMAPTLVFERDAQGRRTPVLATGSPGGAAIIHYVANHLVAVLDWGLPPAEAAAFNQFGAANTPVTVLEANHPQATPALIEALRGLGHTVELRPRASGLATVRWGEGERPLEGVADPRREGAALGR